MSNIKAIFLDADGTLVDHRECEKQALIHLFGNIGIAYKDEYQEIFRPLDDRLWGGDSPVPRQEIPTYRFKVLFEMLRIQYKDYDKANDLFKEGLANSTALMENAVDIVKALHGKGFILCVVTNGLIELQRPRVVNSPIGKYISQVIVSEEVGAYKPDPLIFTTLLDRLGLDANDVIMVGDSIGNDIKGAINAGIRSVWFNPEGLGNESGILPDYEISNLMELTKIVEGLAE